MVDEYLTRRPSYTAGSFSSDSSMVDEYGVAFMTKTCAKWFRFLYGRWIRIGRLLSSRPFPRSDSSMVDEYLVWILCQDLIRRVQIPLWSMNTIRERKAGPGAGAVQIPLWSMNTQVDGGFDGFWHGSDSSMVDEYRGIPRPVLERYWRSDSSMVDEYFMGSRAVRSKQHVQIPLWSMNTLGVDTAIAFLSKFRFLYGRWIRRKDFRNNPPNFCSDSSMVDEYALCDFAFAQYLSVQIPLWSMNTFLPPPAFTGGGSFRFLYGRWIPGWSESVHDQTSRSDSSMVDEYTHTGCLLRTPPQVQIPLWSMNTAGGNNPPDCSSSSDSSMVDEYSGTGWNRNGYTVVQIPLWSMNTRSW